MIGTTLMFFIAYISGVILLLSMGKFDKWVFIPCGLQLLMLGFQIIMVFVYLVIEPLLSKKTLEKIPGEGCKSFHFIHSLPLTTDRPLFCPLCSNEFQHFDELS